MIYKLMLQDGEDLNTVFSGFEKAGLDFCFSDGLLYVVVDYNKPRYLDIIMKKMQIKNYFYQKIKDKPQHIDGNFINGWICEQMEKEELDCFEREHQSELQHMMDNIKHIQNLMELTNMGELPLKEEGDGENKARKASERSAKKNKNRRRH